MVEIWKEPFNASNKQAKATQRAHELVRQVMSALGKFDLIEMDVGAFPYPPGPLTKVVVIKLWVTETGVIADAIPQAPGTVARKKPVGYYVASFDPVIVTLSEKKPPTLHFSPISEKGFFASTESELAERLYSVLREALQPARDNGELYTYFAGRYCSEIIFYVDGSVVLRDCTW
ncbi:MAG: hypothetical protein LM590_01065 [Thermofilum sp.]|nr:hypothetical protein [Thermofilum sp.]